MTQFNEGQEVEVLKEIPAAFKGDWRAQGRRAKIVGLAADQSQPSSDLRYVVEFADGTRGVFAADHIRAR